MDLNLVTAASGDVQRAAAYRDGAPVRRVVFDLAAGKHGTTGIDVYRTVSCGCVVLNHAAGHLEGAGRADDRDRRTVPGDIVVQAGRSGKLKAAVFHADRTAAVDRTICIVAGNAAGNLAGGHLDAAAVDDADAAAQDRRSPGDGSNALAGVGVTVRLFIDNLQLTAGAGDGAGAVTREGMPVQVQDTVHTAGYRDALLGVVHHLDDRGVCPGVFLDDVLHRRLDGIERFFPYHRDHLVVLRVAEGQGVAPDLEAALYLAVIDLFRALVEPADAGLPIFRSKHVGCGNEVDIRGPVTAVIENKDILPQTGLVVVDRACRQVAVRLHAVAPDTAALDARCVFRDRDAVHAELVGISSVIHAAAVLCRVVLDEAGVEIGPDVGARGRSSRLCRDAATVCGCGVVADLTGIHDEFPEIVVDTAALIGAVSGNHRCVSAFVFLQVEVVPAGIHTAAVRSCRVPADQAALDCCDIVLGTYWVGGVDRIVAGRNTQAATGSTGAVVGNRAVDYLFDIAGVARCNIEVQTTAASNG